MTQRKKDPSRPGRDLLCLNLSEDLALSKVEQIRLFRDVGFDGFFAGWGDDLAALREAAEKYSMLFQSVHAPFSGLDALWRGDGAEEMTKSILDCVDGTANAGIVGGGLQMTSVVDCTATGSVTAGNSCYGIGGVSGCGFTSEQFSDLTAQAASSK